MKHSYTYDGIKEMRELVVQEIIKEKQHMFSYPMTADHVGMPAVEDRLRTYMQAGLTVVDLEGGDSRADEEARAKDDYAALATTPAADRYHSTSDTKPDTGVMS